jgi:two-component system sensor histidine kinase BaeS
MRARLGLWPHLLLVAAVGILVASGSIVFLVHRYMVQAYAQRLRLQEAGTARTLDAVLEEAYLGGGESALQFVVPSLARYLGGRIVVYAPTAGGRRRIADSDPGAPLPQGGVSLPLPLVDALGRPVATGYLILANPLTPALGPLDRQLARALIAPAAAGFAGALLLSLLLLERIALPLMQLAAAARRFAKGDLHARVPVRGPREVAEVASEFNRMAEGLARAQTQQRALVADVAHELRTPLTVLRGYVEALRDGLADPDPETVNLIHTETLQLQRLVDDLQDLAQADAADLHLQWGVVDPAELLSTAAAGFRLQAEAKGVQLLTDIPSDLPRLLADRRRLGQVTDNLLANALRYTGPGGTVSLVARLVPDAVRVEVRDTGTGIAAEHLPYLFDRFYRVDPSRARDTGGSGLGLTIARRLVEAHGGEIGVDSAPERGSTFWFTVPLDPPPAGHPAGPLQAGEPARAAGLPGGSR